MSEAKIVLTAVDQTKAALESAKRNIASIGDTVTRATSLMGPMAAGVLSVAGAVTMLSKALDTMDQLDEMSEKTGVSVEALSKLRFAGESVGTTTEQLGGGMRKLAKLMGEAAGGSDEAANIFKTMGVSFKDASGNLRSTDKVLEDMAERFAGWEDGPGKAAAAMKVFGKSGEDMIPMLNLGKDGLANMATEAEKFGIVIGSDAAKAAADFNDNLKKLGFLSEASAAQIVGQFLPGLNKMAEDFLQASKNSNVFLASLIAVQEALKVSFGMDQIGVLEAELKSRSNGIAMLSRQLDIAQKQADSGISGAADRAANIRTQLEAAIKASAKVSENLKELVAPKKPASEQDKAGGRKGGKAPVFASGNSTSSDFGANFVNQLTNQYASLNGELTKVEEVQRMLKISGDKLTQSQRNEALIIAAQIDAFKSKKMVMDSEHKALLDLDEQKKRANEAYLDSKAAMTDEARAMAFATSLIGKNADEVARLTFERELGIRVAKEQAKVSGDSEKLLISEAEAIKRITEIEKIANETRAQFMAQQADQISQQYDAMRGVSDAVKEYQLSISKMGENTKNVMTNAFRGMEDAMVQFVKTGKLDFKSLADSIISDMIRMQIQQSVTGPLSGVLGKAIGSVFGGGGGADFGTGAAYGSQDMGTYFANGGVMTSGGELPLHAYSNGGIANSPQLAVFGEGRMNEAYVPLPDGRTIPVTMSGGGGSNVVVNVMPTSGQTADVQQRQNSDGTTTIDVILRQVQDGLADGVAAGSGSLFNAIGSRFTPRGAQ